MRFPILMIVMFAVAAGSAAPAQQAPDTALRAGITVMRAINTAENAVFQQTGKYIELADLLNHGALGRVRADIVVNGSVITHQGQRLRLALSADATQYHAMVVPADTCGTAVFSDEGGLIYTGKGLGC